MWPLGHAAAGYLCHSLGSDRGWLEALDAHLLVALLVGSQFPDLVDKPLAWWLAVLPTGRSLGHSLLFLVPVGLLVLLVARRAGRPALGVAFVVGAVSHVLVDATPILWGGTPDVAFLLWPVTEVQPYESGPPSILALLQSSLTDPWFLLEFVLAAIALWRWRRDGLPGVEVVRALRRDTGAASS